MSNTSIIDIVSDRLFKSKAFSRLAEKLGAQGDISVAAPISARPLLVAAIFAPSPKSMLVLTSGEEAADHFARELRVWLGSETAVRFPLYTHRPWRQQELIDEHVAQVGARSHALATLKADEPKLVVASVQALLRRLPPTKTLQQTIHFDSQNTKPGQPTYESIKTALTAIGYERFDYADAPGRFSVRGDTIDIWPAGTSYPVRIEYFGDDVEKIRRLVPSTGQSIGMLAELDIHPAKAIVLNEANSKRAIRRLYGLQPEELKTLPTGYSEHIEAIQAGCYFPELELYQPYLYDQTAILLDYLQTSALLVAVEPRSLFDAAAQYYDTQEQSISAQNLHAARAQALVEAIFMKPADLDFGQRQLMTILTMVSGSTGLDLRLEVKHPTIGGSEERLAQAARNYTQNDYLTIIGTAGHQSRPAIELALTDEFVSFTEITTQTSIQTTPRERVALVTDIDLPIAMTMPAAKLALLGLNDNSAASVARRVQSQRGGGRASSKTIQDPTALTFPFKPGDYVVHEIHGIALFKAIVRQEVAGVERDYLHLEYAQGDKLYTPVEQ
ncbi:MAG: hypothetical protein LBU61_03165, partial [Coriobacteriales bacterium]|nr:hypothetical protein [Coriobacteriales bacterium]